jgi:hypothetical protein
MSGAGPTLRPFFLLFPSTTTTHSLGFDRARSLPKGTTLYTIRRRVSCTGTYRVLDVVVIDGESISRLWIPEISAFHRRRLEYVQRGCGYDAGKDLVAAIGSIVHGDRAYFARVALTTRHPAARPPRRLYPISSPPLSHGKAHPQGPGDSLRSPGLALHA